MGEIVGDGKNLVYQISSRLQPQTSKQQQHKCREKDSRFSQHHRMLFSVRNVHGERYEADVHRGGDNLERYVADVETGRDAFEDVSEHASSVALLVVQPLRLVFFRVLLDDPKRTLERCRLVAHEALAAHHCITPGTAGTAGTAAAACGGEVTKTATCFHTEIDNGAPLCAPTPLVGIPPCTPEKCWRECRKWMRDEIDLQLY